MDDSRLTNGLTTATENEHVEPSSGSFLEALAMIASLPLSDADKAEAVRRLLAVKNGQPQATQPADTANLQ